MKKALRMQLRGVPERVREELIENALIEKMSVQNSIQNATVDAETGGQAFAFLAFWSTEYIGTSAVAGPAYSTCIMTSGIKLDVAEEIAGYEESQNKKVVASEPCHCGFFSCARCPVFKKITNRKPVFKRHKLTLKNHINLHNWMLKSATDKGMALIQGRQSKTTSTPALAQMESMHSLDNVHDDAWDGPPDTRFRDEM